MGKLQYYKDRFKALSAQDDKEFEQWVREKFKEEAASIEDEVRNIPDSPDYEPTEEKFQAMLKKAQKKGLLANSKASAANVDDRKEKVKVKQKLKGNLRIYAEKNSNRNKNIILRGKVIKWTAMAAVTAFGFFGVTITSEASRAYIMQEVNKMFGNDVNTEIDNSDVIESSRTEEGASEEIENALGITMPKFFYMPSKMVYQDYSLDEEAQTGIIQYSYEENIVYFMIVSNLNKATGLSRNDMGKKIETISSDLTEGLSMTLWEIKEKGDEKSTYTLSWDYKNTYCELLGKFEKEEIDNIAKKILY